MKWIIYFYTNNINTNTNQLFHFNMGIMFAIIWIEFVINVNSLVVNMPKQM